MTRYLGNKKLSCYRRACVLKEKKTKILTPQVTRSIPLGKL